MLTRAVRSKASFSSRCSTFHPVYGGEQSQPYKPARQLATFPVHRGRFEQMAVRHPPFRLGVDTGVKCQG